MNICIDSNNNFHKDILKNILLPWKINYTNSDDAELIISCNKLNDEEKPTIIIPNNDIIFNTYKKGSYRNLYSKNIMDLNVFVNSELLINFIPENDNIFAVSNDDVINEENSFVINIHDNICMMPFDVINECEYFINSILNPNISNIYSLIMNFPLPYNIIPPNIRNYFFKIRQKSKDILLINHLRFDAIRYLIKNAVEEILKKTLVKKSVDSRAHCCLFTHDIESKQGLVNSLKLKRIEESYDVPSTWFVPSDSFELLPDVINSLSNYGEVGIHGFRHNGHLYRLPDNNMISNLLKAKEKIMNINGKKVIGFRSPLLQYNEKICNNLEKTKFLYDSSIPTWEPKNPLTMKPHGIETIFPFKLNKLIEIPVSIPQDYHMLKVLNYSLKDTVKKWLEINDLIKNIGGLSTFLVHPDYDFSEIKNLTHYEELVSNISSDKDTYISNTSEIVDFVNKK